MGSYGVCGDTCCAGFFLRRLPSYPERSRRWRGEGSPRARSRGLWCGVGSSGQCGSWRCDPPCGVRVASLPPIGEPASAPAPRRACRSLPLPPQRTPRPLCLSDVLLVLLFLAFPVIPRNLPAAARIPCFCLGPTRFSSDSSAHILSRRRGPRRGSLRHTSEAAQRSSPQLNEREKRVGADEKWGGTFVRDWGGEGSWDISCGLHFIHAAGGHST